MTNMYGLDHFSINSKPSKGAELADNFFWILTIYRFLLCTAYMHVHCTSPRYISSLYSNKPFSILTDMTLCLQLNQLQISKMFKAWIYKLVHLKDLQLFHWDDQ